MTLRYLLHHPLQASAARHPDQVAVADGARRMTYAELDTQANRLAHLLHQLGISPGDRVGLCLEKSLEAVVGIYGILKAGAAYVPLDPRAPAPRLGYIAADCGLSCLVTGAKMSRKWDELRAEGAPLRTLLVLDSSEERVEASPADVEVVTAAALAPMPERPPPIPTIDADLAYILYTSGSTGVPKGVMLSHRNGLAFVEWAVDEFRVRSDDRLSGHAPFHFDLSIFDLFAASLAGAALALVPSRLSVFPIEVARFIEREGITVWYSVPSILIMLTEHGGLETGSLPSLRTMLFAGEVFPSKYLARLMALLPHVEFANLYGPTETNVCTAYRVPAPPDPAGGDIPIGQAIANDLTLVVTEDGRLAPPGEVGELLVRGATVMQGYWGDPEKTAQRLVPNPFGPGLVYRTGDLVVEEDDGNYRFLGRQDHQVKSRGYRIELGEIETTLNTHPQVVECVVVAIPDEMISNRLKAFVASGDHLTEGELVEFCAARLPRYMVPESFEFRDALPKTSTGKIDRQALAVG
ncbi:MAG: amino acid adenylation domain-containing protein [Acidimicrobiia bacterium]